jgi:hypothetical protein
MPKRVRLQPAQKLIVSRTEAAEMLGGVSTLTLIRLEHAGRLKPIRLTRRASGKVFYSFPEILALAQGSEDATT